MQKNLGLTDQQVAEIRKIRDEGGSREQILAVLTDHQIEIMKERRAKMKGKGRNGGRQAPAGEAQDSETTDQWYVKSQQKSQDTPSLFVFEI